MGRNGEGREDGVTVSESLYKNPGSVYSCFTQYTLHPSFSWHPTANPYTMHVVPTPGRNHDVLYAAFYYEPNRNPAIYSSLFTLLLSYYQMYGNL